MEVIKPTVNFVKQAAHPSKLSLLHLTYKRSRCPSFGVFNKPRETMLCKVCTLRGVCKKYKIGTPMKSIAKSELLKLF